MVRRFARGEAYDEQAMPELDSEALDFRAASESFAPVRKLKRSDMETLRLVVKHQGRMVPTVGGILLFGKERERILSRCLDTGRPFSRDGQDPYRRQRRKSGAIRCKPSKRPSPSSRSFARSGDRRRPARALTDRSIDR